MKRIQWHCIGLVLFSTLHLGHCKKDGEDRYMAAGHAKGKKQTPPPEPIQPIHNLPTDTPVAPPPSPPAPVVPNPVNPPPANAPDSADYNGYKMPPNITGPTMKECNDAGKAWIMVQEDGKIIGSCGDNLASIDCKIEELQKLVNPYPDIKEKFDEFYETYGSYDLYNCSEKDGNITFHWLKIDNLAVGYAYFTYMPTGA